MRTVLTIDDSMPVRAVVRQALEAAGFSVLEASSVEDAYRQLNGVKLHLILCDYNMPGDNGVNFTRTIKTEIAYQNYRFTPVIMMTTESDPQKKQAGREAGVSAWVVKPFVPASVVAAVQKLALPE
ncbi:MAG: response regulator [Leptospirales bacterium]|nr:response regulator [Leptospirales bacterium]